MGTFKKGVLGSFSGKIGTVVGASWKGVEYMRSRADIRRHSNTPAQDAQRVKFAVAVKFLGSMKTLILTSFKQAGNMTGVNSAISYTLKNAITGIYPDLTVDYKQVLVARGSLPNASSPEAEARGTTIHFSWTSNTGTGIARDADKAVVVAYHAPTNQAFYHMEAAGRSDENAVLPVPGMAGEQVETWLAFISADGRDSASSVYTGRVTLG